MLKLQIPVNGKGDLFEFQLDKEKITVGRRHDNDIRIKESYLSAYHAEFSLEPGGGVFVRDRDSVNGTRLNGNPVKKKERVASGDVIRFGSLDCFIAASDEIEGALAPQPLEALVAPKPSLEKVVLLKNELEEIRTKLSQVCTEAEEDELNYCQEIAFLKKEIVKTRSEKHKLSRELQESRRKSDNFEKSIEKAPASSVQKFAEAEATRDDSAIENEVLKERAATLETEKGELIRQVFDQKEKLDLAQKNLETSAAHLAALESKHEASKNRISFLEDELKQLREDFSTMEKNYRLRISESKLQNNETSHIIDQLKEELSEARRLNELQEDCLLQLHSEIGEMTSIIAVFQQRTAGVESLEQRVLTLNGEVDQLNGRKQDLENETRKLTEEKKKQGLYVDKAQAERAAADVVISDLRTETEKASHKLDILQQRLRDSEKKVSYLRSLEAELEKAVLRSQRSALSRKGIYTEDNEEGITIWPQTEQVICRELIERLELLDDLLKRYQQSWFFPTVADQLNILRESFMKMLRDHYVDRFDLEPGTELSIESRKKIQLISLDDFGDPKRKKSALKGTSNRTTVIETVRPGYVYTKGGQDIIIRKAEVIVV